MIDGRVAESTEQRLPLPEAYTDPAFMSCLHGAIETTELVENFDRLYGASLVKKRSPIAKMIDAATGKDEDDMRAFVEFVHDAIYLRLPVDAIHSLRMTAAANPAREARA